MDLQYLSLGSIFAFNIIGSLTLLALLSTYMISISSILRKRLLGDASPARPLVPRPLSHRHQWLRVPVFSFRDHVLLLPGLGARHEQRELGPGRLGKCYCAEWRYLCAAWEEALYGTGGVCGGEEREGAGVASVD
jgi:hypothetical protein